MWKKMSSIGLLSVGILWFSLGVPTSEASAASGNQVNILLDKLSESGNVRVNVNEDGTYTIAGNPNEEEQNLINSINDLYFASDVSLLASLPITFQDTGTASDGDAMGGTRITANLGSNLDFVDYTGYSGGSWLGSGTPSFIQVSTTLTTHGSAASISWPAGFTISSNTKSATIKHKEEKNTKTFQATYSKPGTFQKSTSFLGYTHTTKVESSAVVEVRINGHSYTALPSASIGG